MVPFADPSPTNLPFLYGRAIAEATVVGSTLSIATGCVALITIVKFPSLRQCPTVKVFTFYIVVNLISSINLLIPAAIVLRRQGENLSEGALCSINGLFFQLCLMNHPSISIYYLSILAVVRGWSKRTQTDIRRFGLGLTTVLFATLAAVAWYRPGYVATNHGYCWIQPDVSTEKDLVNELLYYYLWPALSLISCCVAVAVIALAMAKQLGCGDFRQLGPPLLFCPIQLLYWIVYFLDRFEHDQAFESAAAFVRASCPAWTVLLFLFREHAWYRWKLFFCRKVAMVDAGLAGQSKRIELRQLLSPRSRSLGHGPGEFSHHLNEFDEVAEEVRENTAKFEMQFDDPSVESLSEWLQWRSNSVGDELKR